MGGYKPAITQEEKILQRRVAQAVKSVQHSGVPRFFTFLDEREQQLAVAQLNHEVWHEYSFWGGYPDAQRRMLCIYEAQPQAFPLSVIKVCAARVAQQLTHRDYLGAILATRLKRECIGDIITAPQYAMVFVQTAILTHLEEQLHEVGRVNVTVQAADFEKDLPAAQTPMRCSATVSSLRLDAVLAAMLQSSRGKATPLIQKGLIQVNHLQTLAPHTLLEESDVISVKGVGRFQLNAVGGKSRKERTFIEFLKF